MNLHSSKFPVLLFASSVLNLAGNDLTVTKLSEAPAADDPSVLLRQTIGDPGGNTRIRFYPARQGLPGRFDNNANAYRFSPRDRDLGQSFTIPANLTQNQLLEAVTLKVGPEASANEGAAGGAAVSLQIFEVEGIPIIDQNGTTGNDRTRWDTFAPDKAFTDDFYTGLTFTSLGVYSGGSLPVDISSNDYMRWELGTPIEMEPGKQYAFMVMFDEPAPNRGLALANWNRAVIGDLGPDDGAISFRRCGSDPDFDAVFIPDLNNAADVEIGRASASLPLGFATRTALAPSPVGYPDVDTYRDFVYYIHTSAAGPVEEEDKQTSGISGRSAAPVGPFDSEGSRDGNGATVRWRQSSGDTDLGAIFKSGPVTRQLCDVTVQVVPNNFGNAVAGTPVIFDFMKVDGTLANPTFVPLWREEGTFPDPLFADDFITFHLLDRNQVLEKDSLYAFVIGVNREAASAVEAAQRFRLYGNVDGSATPDTYEIRREFEFGTTRPSLSVAPNILNPGRDFYFLLRAFDIKPKIASFAYNQDSFQVVAPSLMGGQYVLERSSNLQDPWTEIATQVGSGSTLTFLDSPLPAADRNFYRIKVGP